MVVVAVLISPTVSQGSFLVLLVISSRGTVSKWELGTFSVNLVKVLRCAHVFQLHRISCILKPLRSATLVGQLVNVWQHLPSLLHAQQGGKC